jgi:hypothetical protein
MHWIQEESVEDRKRGFAFTKDFYDRAVGAKPKDPQIYLSAAQFYLRRKRDFAKCMDLHKQALRLVSCSFFAFFVNVYFCPRL